MRRIAELILYAVVILFFIARYAEVGDDGPSRPRPQLPAPEDKAVFVPDDAPLPRDIERSVNVELDERAQNSVGTAFAVDRQGTYVTARHVVDGCAVVYLVAGRGRLEQVLSSISEGTRDFAILRTTNLRATPFSLTEVSPRRGSDGYMMGYPQGRPGDVRATVIGRTEMRSTGRYRMREPVVAWVERERRPTFGGSLSGISGGPVFDGNGYVVGTVVAGAPRRGRVYTTHPQIFRATGLMARAPADRALKITRADFKAAGDQLRASRSIAQVYCKAR